MERNGIPLCFTMFCIRIWYPIITEIKYGKKDIKCIKLCIKNYFRKTSYLLDQGVGVWGAMSKTFGCKSLDNKAYGFDFWGVVQVGTESAPGMITDDSDTLWLDNLEYELAGGACGAVERGGVIKNWSNK